MKRGDIEILCPKCGIRTLTQRCDYDPDRATLISVLCPECAAGDFAPVEYFDICGRPVPAAGASELPTETKQFLDFLVEQTLRDQGIKPAERTPQDTRSVYFVCELSSRLVKIGYARDADERLKSLQCGNPNDLILLGTIPGGPKKEGELHRRFRRLRVRGEWFRPAKELLDFIFENARTPNREGGEDV